jgi:protein O-GlcNAc transferase
MTIPQAFQIAVQRHQAGRLAEAEALYRQILAAQPNHADALHLLGLIAHQAGRYDLAVEWIRKAIAANPSDSYYYLNLGNAMAGSGQFDEAIASYRRAIQIRPDCPEAHNNLGAALRDRGKLTEAIVTCRRALDLKPAYPEAHTNLGNALRDQGDLDESIACYRRALQLKPSLPEAHNNLGNALRDRGEWDEAMAAFRRALELKPNYAEAQRNLGHTFRDRGELEEAITAYRRALQLEPNFPEAHNDMGSTLMELGRVEEAIAACRIALQLKPGFAESHNNLGNALRECGRLDAAIAAYRNAAQIAPRFSAALANLGSALKDRGNLDEAIDAFWRAIQIEPEQARFHSALIHTLHFRPGLDGRAIPEEHRRWNLQFSEPSKPMISPHSNDRSPDRRLRVGYVSPDFRDHPVGRYALPFFEQHDRERFEILCYSGVTRPDAITERLRALAGKWRNTVGVPDGRLAEMIREDGVDLLVDLALHTEGNRLPMFARQPAPVQVAWLGYPGSSGLPGIGYRLTDSHMDPPGSRSRGTAWSAEEPARLPDCWCCYDPVDKSPEVNVPPGLSAKGVTFGSLNNFAKVNEGVLSLWARVLEAAKGSRLLMLCPEGEARQRVGAFFSARGIAPERLELTGSLPRWEYLSLYQRIDIGLDPFPCNGMTTTCDALWMGAPVVTLPGKMPVARAGLSLLSSVGLGEFVASSEEDYVRIAVELAGNLPRLANLRAIMRRRMQASPLMDAPRFARNVEAAYRSMWERWCRGEA